jgi:hypothetical protein
MVQRPIPLPVDPSRRWRQLYSSVILEPDQTKWSPRIAEARAAILDRAEEIRTSQSGDEHLHLNNALRTLRSLEEVAAREKRAV